jgi:hypothetical protein
VRVYEIKTKELTRILEIHDPYILMTHSVNDRIAFEKVVYANDLGMGGIEVLGMEDLARTSPAVSFLFRCRGNADEPDVEVKRIG